MKAKNKNYFVAIAILFIFLLFSVVFLKSSFAAAPAATPFTYIPLETIPGVLTAGVAAPDFNTYIGKLYTFLVSIAGICALFMITVGGYMYITSAGNTATLGQAKNIIKDAIIGLLLALLTYLIFYTINPALVNPPGLTSVPAITPGGAGTQNGTGGVPGSGTEEGGVPGAGNTGAQVPGGSSQIHAAIANNSSGIDPKILSAIMGGGEGWNKNVSTDGFGSCGYSQTLPAIRTACGIVGTPAETCQKIQNDPQLDANCAAWLIKDNAGRCGMDIQNVASCYNTGKPNNCANSTNNYCGRVSAAYSSA